LTFLNTQRFSGYFAQVSLPDDSVIHRTPNLGQCRLPLEPAPKELDPNNPIVVKTLTDDAAHQLGGTSGLRFLTLYERQPGKQHFNLELARGLDIMNQRIAALRRVFIVAIPLGLLASGAASWFVARRSLAPIAKVVREAQSLNVTDLHRRIETPVGGDEVAEMVSVINKMLDRLEAAFRSQEHFIADVSHELKTPLAVLIGEAQVLLQRDRSQPEYLRFVASVQDELQRLTRIVHSLLMLARADSGLPLLGALPLSVNEVVTDSVH
jgi:signal transduction histidine kinase